MNIARGRGTHGERKNVPERKNLNLCGCREGARETEVEIERNGERERIGERKGERGRKKKRSEYEAEREKEKEGDGKRETREGREAAAQRRVTEGTTPGRGTRTKVLLAPRDRERE